MVAAASKGIGLAVAQALAREGCRVSICSRSADSLAEACGQIEGTVRGHVCDVSLPEDLERWYGATRVELGVPEILMTNTGGPPAGPVDQITDDQWRAGVDSTLLNVVRMVRLAGPGMVERGWGRIVHITSLVARDPSPMLPISSTLRAGLLALTRLQAEHFAPSGVTVNAVLPGHTMTDRQTHLASIRAKQLGISEEAALRLQADEVPMKRLAEAREIADAVAYLCSARASYITAQSLLVDGGMARGV
jgi:3-oxoacyl-[acyl-carrier protein] reductase